MSAVLFNVVINWVMQKTTEDSPRGIHWSLFSTLEDLNFVDDLALLSHTHQHIQEKTDCKHMENRWVYVEVPRRQRQ
jgi:hypothetical protein